MELHIGQEVDGKWLVAIEGSKIRPRLRVIDSEPTKDQIKKWQDKNPNGFVFRPGKLLTHKESCELLGL
jgi:hypothetical protein